MALATQRPKPAKIRRGIEWTTIPIWYLYAGGTAITVVVLVGGFLIYQALFGPANKARRAVAHAESLFQEATRVAKPGEHDRLLKTAETKLDSAHGALEDEGWDLAIIAARDSVEASQEILGSVGGQEINVARFTRISGKVEVKRHNSTQWIPATLDTPLSPNDLVRSDGSSRAEIQWPNRTRIVVEPASLLKMIRPATEQESVAEVPHGGVQVQTVQYSGGEKTILRAPGNTEIDIGEDSTTEVRADETSGETSIRVARGQTKVRKDDEEVLVSNNQAVQVADRIGEVEQLPERPSVPSDVQTFARPSDGESLARITWSPISDAVKYLVELGNDPLLAGRDLQIFEVTDSAFEVVDYPDGTYYWRVSALDATGHRSLPSAVGRFHIGEGGEQISQQASVPIPSLFIDSINALGVTVIMKGRTDPNVNLSVGGEAVDVKSDGTWVSVTALHEEGRNEVMVVARNALGGVHRKRVIVNAQYF